MKDIKVKEKFKTGIKTVDRTAILTSKVKKSVDDIRDRNNILNDEKTSNIEYADDKIEMMINKSKNAIVNSSKEIAIKTKNKMIRRHNKIKIGDKNDIKPKNFKQIKNTQDNVERAKKITIKTKQATQ